MLLSFAYSFVAAKVYFITVGRSASVEAKDSGFNQAMNNFTSKFNGTTVENVALTELREDTVWWVLLSVSAAWLVAFAIFIRLMKKEYRRTFFSFESGNERCQSYFLNGITDSVKIRTLDHNKRKWEPIRERVKAWTLSNWDRWEDEKPEWFTERWKAGLDDDMIPAAALVELRMINGGVRRRSSVTEKLFASTASIGNGEIRRKSSIAAVLADVSASIDRARSATVIPLNEDINESPLTENT